MQTRFDLLLIEESPLKDMLWTQHKKDEDIDGGDTDSRENLRWSNRRLQLVRALPTDQALAT